jgi:hypothetical protein
MAPLQRELHRRVWWGIYIGDRASSCAEKGYLLLSEAQSILIALPACV